MNLCVDIDGTVTDPVYGDLLHIESVPQPGARDILTMLHAQQHSIHFVSEREERMRSVTEEWLMRYRMPYDSIVLLGDPNKTCKARQFKCDLFIEDSLDNALQLANDGFLVALLDRSYNQGWLPAHVLRVCHWKEIFELIFRRTAGLCNPLSA